VLGDWIKHLRCFFLTNTIEPRFNEVPGDWGSWFVIQWFFSIHSTFTGLKNMVRYIPRTSLYRGSLSRGSTVSRVLYTAVLSHTFYFYWAEEYGSLYQGLRYIEVR